MAIYLKPSRGERKFQLLEEGTFGFCLGGKSAPDPPDYGPVAGASQANAKYSAQVAREQLAWQKEMWADQQKMLTQVTDVQLPIMEMQAEMAGVAMEQQAWAMQKQMELYEKGMITSEELQRSQLAIQSQLANSYQQGLAQQMRISEENHRLALQDRDRYERIFQPIEEDLVQKALIAGSEEEKALAAGRAQSDVARAQEAQRKQAQMQLESYGVDPSQTRSQALDAGLRTQQASAQAAAGNQARQAQEDRALAMQADVIGIGRGLGSNIASSYNAALQGASGAAAPGFNVGAGAAGMNAAGNALGSIQSGANSMMGNLSNTMSGLMGGAGAWQNASNAMGSPTSWLGQSNNAIGQWGNTLNQGYGNDMAAANFNANNSMFNTVAPVAAMGLGTMFADGGEVQGPGGPKDDAIPARLSDGEYIVPAEVVRKKGTDFFDKLKEKAQKELAEEEQQQAAQQQEAQMRQQALQAPPTQHPQVMGYAGGGPVYPYDGPAPAAGAPVYYAEGGPVYDGARGYAPGEYGRVYEGEYWEEPVQSFADGGQAKSDGLWSGENPRPMFGYNSAAAQKGQKAQQAARLNRSKLLQNLQGEMQNRAWKNIKRSNTGGTTYYPAPDNRNPNNSDQKVTEYNDYKLRVPDSPPVPDKPPVYEGPSLAERMQAIRDQRAAEEAARIAAEQAAAQAAAEARARAEEEARRNWQPMFSNVYPYSNSMRWMDEQGISGHGQSSQRYSKGPTLAYDPYAQADKLRKLNLYGGGGNQPTYSSMGLD